MITVSAVDTQVFPVTALKEGCVVLAALLVIILIEAVVLRRVMPGVRPFRDSAVMNSASAAAALPVLIGWTFPRSGQPHRPISGYPSSGLQPFELLAVSWILSVIVEGLILYILERDRRPRQMLRASILVNTVSYGLLALVVAGDLAARILT